MKSGPARNLASVGIISGLIGGILFIPPLYSFTFFLPGFIFGWLVARAFYAERRERDSDREMRARALRFTLFSGATFIGVGAAALGLSIRFPAYENYAILPLCGAVGALLIAWGAGRWIVELKRHQFPVIAIAGALATLFGAYLYLYIAGHLSLPSLWPFPIIVIAWQAFVALSIRSDKYSAFTLVELLVVIAVIAVLAVVVVLALNPAELLKQARDANRSSDLSTMDSAISLYMTDQAGSSGFSLGSTTVTYISLPDPTATTTAGTDCSGIGLGGLGYHCVSPSSLRKTDGTGWIPIDLANISAGNPISDWPIDPVNTTSSGYYYKYATDGNEFEIAAVPESQKQMAISGQMKNGSSATLIPCAQYAETGAVATWTVPSGVKNITVTANGAGGESGAGSPGGAGGQTVGTLAVSAGQVYYFSVGGTGILYTGGYDGGGLYGGGGMTWFGPANSFSTTSVILVAGGGGGGASGGNGGAGGGINGGNGSQPYGAFGGTQTAGGGYGGNPSTGGYTGTAGQGGGGSGGGGGGYYGGGGGGTDPEMGYPVPGGGGSGFVSSTLTGTSTTQGGGSPSGVNGNLTISCS